jgi:hypothetical protein
MSREVSASVMIGKDIPHFRSIALLYSSCIESVEDDEPAKQSRAP